MILGMEAAAAAAAAIFGDDRGCVSSFYAAVAARILSIVSGLLAYM